MSDGNQNKYAHFRSLKSVRFKTHSCLLDLLPEDAFEGDSISSKLADTFSQFLDGHLLFVEVEPEERLVIQVASLGDVKFRCTLGVKLLWHIVCAVIEFLEQIGGDGQVVTTSQLGDLTNIPEGGTHDDSVVAVFLVVVEDGLNALDTWVFLWLEVFLHGCLVPVEDSADEGRDQVGTGFGGSDSLDKGEHEGQIAVNALLLEDLGGLNSFISGCDLDQDAVFGNSDRVVELLRVNNAPKSEMAHSP